MKKQKNRFWLFVFSLCPGAGHMYMGLMRMGLSFMLGFMVMIALVAITGISVLVVLPITLYIYAFFHANNIGGLEPEQFAALEDEYLFGISDWNLSRFKLDKKSRNIAAVVCIVLGVSMLWNVGFGMIRDYVGWDNPIIRAVYYTMRDEVPRIIIALAIIWFGVSLLRGKKVDFAEDDRQASKDSVQTQAVLTTQKAEVQMQETQRQNPGGQGWNDEEDENKEPGNKQEGEA